MNTAGAGTRIILGGDFSFLEFASNVMDLMGPGLSDWNFTSLSSNYS